MKRKLLISTTYILTVVAIAINYVAQTYDNIDVLRWLLIISMAIAMVAILANTYAIVRARASKLIGMSLIAVLGLLFALNAIFYGAVASL